MFLVVFTVGLWIDAEGAQVQSQEVGTSSLALPQLPFLSALSSNKVSGAAEAIMIPWGENLTYLNNMDSNILEQRHIDSCLPICRTLDLQSLEFYVEKKKNCIFVSILYFIFSIH